MVETIFDLMASIKPQWKEVATRKFKENEIAAVESAKVIQGKFSKSVLFVLLNSKKFIVPLEPSASKRYEVDEDIPVSQSELVELVYDGDDPEFKGKHCRKLRVLDGEPSEITNFDNPFGL